MTFAQATGVDNDSFFALLLATMLRAMHCLAFAHARTFDLRWNGESSVHLCAFAPKNWRNTAEIRELTQHRTLPPAEDSAFPVFNFRNSCGETKCSGNS